MTHEGTKESRMTQPELGARPNPRCICDQGFGMNLSCPLHKPQGREYHEAIEGRFQQERQKNLRRLKKDMRHDD